MDPILEILEKDAHSSPEEIAKMLGKKPNEVKEAIKDYEKKGVIVRYKAVLNKELTTDQKVRALIEVQTTPQRGAGFDSIAHRIYHFPEVKSCYLLSGAYDLLVVVEGEDLQSVAAFVSEKLSTLDHVRGTVTHFLLKTYKEEGDLLLKEEHDHRIAVSP